MTQTPRDWHKDEALLQLCQRTAADENEKHVLSIGLHWLQEDKTLQEIASGRGREYLKVHGLLKAAEAREQRLKDVVKRAVVMLDEIVPHQFDIQTEMEILLSTLYLDTPAPAAPTPGITARPIDEWHEDYGDALWWTFPILESPYCGSPLDSAWPDYHTHWTPLVIPSAPKEGE
jgi:hypothetical protein